MDEIARIKKTYEKRIEKGFIDRYSLFYPGELYMLQRREEEALRLLAHHHITDLRNLRILDIGCGRGARLIDWARWGARPSSLFGIDLLEVFVREAREMSPGAHICVGSGNCLPFPNGSFDVVSQSTVFSSILDSNLKRAVADEMERVVAPGGFMLWYDFRYPNVSNTDVKPIRYSELAALFPGRNIDVRSVTLLPPLARNLASFSVLACRILERSIPVLRSHTLAFISGKSR
jgi:ubiquinone/menaquinone biosynthesis C-methylase UbiE